MGSVEFDLRRHMASEDAKDQQWDAMRPEIEAQAIRDAQALITEADWWKDMLEGSNPATSALPLILSDLMRNVDAACGGCAISNKAILSALCRLQRVAFNEAHDEAEEKAEADALEALKAMADAAATRGEGEL